MNIILNHFYNHAKLFMLLGFAFAVIFMGLMLRTSKEKVNEISVYRDNNSHFLHEYTEFNDSVINSTAASAHKQSRRKEYLYRLLTNTTRSLIQMEIKARRLEENMRRIKEKTADLLWKNKDKALWHILFKNISRHISIRHEFHQHASLKRIMMDSHKHKKINKRKRFLD